MNPTFLSRARWALPLLAALLAACGTSPAPRYHTLAGGAGSATGSPAFLVEVLPVSLPAAMDRAQVVIGPASAGRVAVGDGERWAAPLGEEVRQALARSLWQARRAADVYRVPASGGDLPRYRLAFGLEAVDARPGAGLTASALWTLRPVAGGGALTCRSTVQVPIAGAGTEATVLALAAAVDRLGQAVAQALPSGGPLPGCPVP